MIFHKRLGFTPTYFETPGPTSGGQGAAPAGVQAAAQGGDGGGLPTAEQQGDMNWGLFPDVPEDQRQLLQPHLKGVLGHVTRVEQQLAPYKALSDAGFSDPNVIAGLTSFAQSFDRDPVGTWYALGAKLQEDGELTQDIDFEVVKSLMEGTYQEADPGQMNADYPDGFDPESPVGQLILQQQETIQQLQDQVGGVLENARQREVAAQQAREDRLLDRAINDITTSLTRMGVPQEAISREFLMGQIITHRGNVESIVKSLSSFRDGGVKTVIRNATTRRPAGLNMPRGAPPAPNRPTTFRSPFDEARAGATQYLKQQRAFEGQEA